MLRALLAADRAPPGRPLVDWVHVVRLTGWRKSLFEMPTLEQIARVWNDVRSVNYQVAVDLQGAIRSAVLARMSRAPVIYGARQTRESPATLFYTRQEIARGSHVIEQNLSLVQALTGTSLHAGPVQLPRDLATEQRIHERLAEAGTGKSRHHQPRRWLGRKAVARTALWRGRSRAGLLRTALES